MSYIGLGFRVCGGLGFRVPTHRVPLGGLEWVGVERLDAQRHLADVLGVPDAAIHNDALGGGGAGAAVHNEGGGGAALHNDTLGEGGGVHGAGQSRAGRGGGRGGHTRFVGRVGAWGVGQQLLQQEVLVGGNVPCKFVVGWSQAF